MFFKQVRRNAAKNRKGNGLFFGSLVIAIIAFYTLLSLGEQDVMRFLKTIESDAVSKLLLLLPIVYAVSLFFVFFLVYFACKYQTDSRRKELGMYLMLGMKRSRLFSMLICETLVSSLIALLIGIPAALLLTEGISLITVKAVGLGIIGHRLSFSLSAVIWTVLGFILVQLLSMAFICAGLGKAEPAELLSSESADRQKHLSPKASKLSFILGAVLLFAAYLMGVFLMRTLSPIVFLAVIVGGIAGTFLLYRGLGGFLGQRISKKSGEAVGLDTFTSRQVQENVLSQHKSLAIASLLLMMALSCISFGISMGGGRSAYSRSVDFSLFGAPEEIDAVLEREEVSALIKDQYPLQLSVMTDEFMYDGEKAVDLSELTAAIDSVDGSDGISDSLYLSYVISESSYDRILRNIGKEELDLSGNRIAFYSSLANEGEYGVIMDKVLKSGVSVGIDGVSYEALPAIYYDNIVADRAITLYIAMIVPDDLYGKLAREAEDYCRNVQLSDETVESAGLMMAIRDMDDLLAGTDLEYDSYLGGIGRNLFYNVAASYLTIYLGVLFWLIANTVIGLKYLIGQRKTKHRYETLLMLGADTEAMTGSVKKQISVYFALVLSVALLSSAAAILSMFTSFARLPVGVSVLTVALISAAALAVFAGFELLYIRIVKRAAAREIRDIDITESHEAS